jgi:hypothetical protein
VSRGKLKPSRDAEGATGETKIPTVINGLIKKRRPLQDTAKEQFAPYYYVDMFLGV